MHPDHNWESYVLSHPGLITYQLLINLGIPRSIQAGRLGCFEFPAGYYLYTGSARRNLVARVRRHLSENKTSRWHIDYLLEVKDARVVELHFSDQLECRVNQQSDGVVLAPGFGASDCRAHCVSHLKYLGETN